MKHATHNPTDERNPDRGHRTLRIAIAALALTALGAGTSTAQPTYSIDAQSPTVGTLGLGSESDILTPIGAGTIPPPALVIPGGAAGLGIGFTAPGFRELDALSYGREQPLGDDPTQFFQDWTFSVDEFAVGLPAVPAPSVTSEGAFSPVGEASADIYVTTTAPGPVPPFAPGVNTGLFDGNGGVTPFPAPGLNLREPNTPTFFGTDIGDNLDAWDIDTPPPAVIAGQPLATPVYYSLDSNFVDPFEGPPYNTGTALANGFVGGDVLVTTTPGGPPVLYAPAITLGLDLNGTDTDDLDALVLWDNGDGVYQPTSGPYSWLAANGTDMLLYSVRRGSALIGTPDSIMGLAIEEGDILVPVLVGGGAVVPGIFVPAEALGLATVRSGLPTLQGRGDDLDALDVQERLIPEPTSIALLTAAAVLASARRRIGR